MASRNPFRPTFGSSPPRLVGRDLEMGAFAAALEEGPGAPGRATLYVGARGVGKTVLLNEAEAAARQRGWLVISETATEGLVARIRDRHLPAAALKLTGETDHTRLFSLQAFGFGASWDHVEVPGPAGGLRTRLTELADGAARGDTGVLITVDEVHAALLPELRELATTIQHLFREELPVALAAAGLPAAVNDVLSDDVLTFLRRADLHHLGPVDDDAVSAALRDPIEGSGRSITDEDLARAADATRGYPFMIQLVGYSIWAQNPEGSDITRAEVDAGVATAGRRLGQLVVAPALGDLSTVDRSFLVAMAHDDGPSVMGDIANRLDVDANYASQYRLRLLHAEVIEPAGRGQVDFVLPAMRDYLKERGTLDLALPLSNPELDSGARTTTEIRLS
jgi:hypothetical protein